MGLMYIDDIRPGMKLSQDIRDQNGRFLLGKGLTIQDKHLRIFKIWGVSQVSIQGAGEQEDNEGRDEPAQDSQAMLRAKSRILKRFSGHDPESRLSRQLVDIFTMQACNDPENYNAQDLSGAEAVQGGQPLQSDCKPADPEARLGDDVNLVSLPEIFFLIQDAIKDPRTSSRHIGEIVSKDQALAAKLLKLVNSPFYGFPSKIDTISRAVTILGTRQLSSLALGLSAISRFKDIDPGILDMESFWKHNIACAIGAKTLAGLCKLPNSEMYFVCGLLHDLGRLVMLHYYPDNYLMVLNKARSSNIRLSKAEKMFFRHDHATLGGRLVKKWRLPLRIEEAIRYHDKPALSRFRTETTMVHMANILANGCRIGTSGEALIPVPDEQCWQDTRLELSTLQQTVRLTLAQVDNIYRLLFERA